MKCTQWNKMYVYKVRMMISHHHSHITNTSLRIILLQVVCVRYAATLLERMDELCRSGAEKYFLYYLNIFIIIKYTPLIYTEMFNTFIHLLCLPDLYCPICLHTISASAVVQELSQIVPHCPSTHTSIVPSLLFTPPTSLICPVVHLSAHNMRTLILTL